MRRIRKILFSCALLVALSHIVPFNAYATSDTGVEETNVPSGGQAGTPVVPPPPSPPVVTPEPTIKPEEEVIDPEDSQITPVIDPTVNDRGGLVVRWVQLSAVLLLIAVVGWFVYEAISRGSRRPLPQDQGVTRSGRSKETTTVFPSSNPIPPLDPIKTIEQITAETAKTTRQLKKPQLEPATAKVERPVLSTSSTPSKVVSQPSALSTGNSEESASVSNAANVEADQVKIEPLVEVSSASQERVIVQPPQIGEPSSFARHDWWDKDREWCQVSPFGMSSDVVCDIGTFGTVAIAAASLRGHKHKVSGEPCQDAFSLRTTQSQSGQKYVVAVLCDGMSSAKHSEYGARRASQLLAWSLAAMVEDQEEITEQRVKSVLPKIFEYCKQNLMPQKRNQFGASGISPKEVVESDFFTTVTFMIIPADSGEEEILEAIVGSIGDSAVFVLNNSTTLWEEIAAVDASSEILNPATSAFPATFDAKVSTIFVNKSDLVIATSDGVGNFINVRGNQTSLGTYLAKQWGKPVNLPTFINDVGFDLKSADDDRTVIAIWLSRSE